MKGDKKMLTRGKDGKIIDVDDDNLIPWMRHKQGAAAKLTEDYVSRNADTMPKFTHDDVVDIMLEAWRGCEEYDPESLVIHGIYYGLALAEKSQKVK